MDEQAGLLTLMLLYPFGRKASAFQAGLKP
jgi:hypothetical protein